jgi:putative ABC transport system permease protein
VIYPFNENNNFEAGFILVKLNGTKINESLDFIKSKWDHLSNNYLFEYTFLDKDFERLFEREQITAKIYTIFSIISIVIACLGLIGMSSFFASKRRKEIGIRKVNGAKVSQIMTLLNMNFVKWLVIAFVITCPVAYYIMQQWLANFAYKTSLSWWVFGLAGMLTASIALISVSWQSYKAARVNPVKSLRSE